VLRLKYVKLVGSPSRAAQVFVSLGLRVPGDLEDWFEFEEGEPMSFAIPLDPMLGGYGAKGTIRVLEALREEGFNPTLTWGGFIFLPHPEQEELLRLAKEKSIPVAGLPDGGQG